MILRVSNVISKPIKSGAHVHFIKAEKFKTNLLSLYITVPYDRENAALCSLLPKVLRRGCKKYPSLDLMAKKMEDLYGASFYSGLRKNGDGAGIYFSMEFVSDKYINEKIFDDAVDFLKKVVFCPKLEEGVFDKKYVESEKKNLKDDILGLINDKKEYADQAVKTLAFPESNYSIPAGGSIEDAEKITPESLFEFYKFIISNCRFDIFLSGSFGKTEESVLESFFADFEPRETENKKTESTKNYKIGEIKRKTEKLDVTQSKLCMMMYTFSDDFGKEKYAFRVFNCIYGGSPFSKLFNNVREKLSLAYYVSSRLDSRKGCMLISSGIEGDKFEAAYNEIMLWLEKICGGEFSEEEIYSAKKYLETSINSVGDSLRACEDYYASRICCGETPEDIEELLSGIKAVKKEEIIEAAKKVKLAAVYLLTGK